MAGVKRIDHVAIAVRDLDASRQTFEDLYGAEFLGETVNDEGQYRLAYFRLGDSMVTMLQGTTPESFVAKHVEQRGEGIQHVGIEVDDLEAFLARLEAGGARVSNRKTVEGIRTEALVSPRSAFGIILQPIEWLGDLKDAPPDVRLLRAGGL
jgi:methylmalonyl-CoA epimerase